VAGIAIKLNGACLLIQRLLSVRTKKDIHRPVLLCCFVNFTNYDTIIRIIIGDMSYVHIPNFVARTYDVYNKNYIPLFKPTLATPFSSMYKLHTLITATRCIMYCHCYTKRVCAELM